MDFKSLYTDPDFSGAFSGANTFYRALKNVDPSVKKKDVDEYLKSNKAYTLHKVVRRPTKFRRVYTKGIKYLYQIDLIDIPKLAYENDGKKYLITVIDTFSKYAWVYPTATKQGKEVYDQLKALLLVERPDKCQTDLGREFYNKTFKALMTALNIKHYSTGSHLKASIVERFNRTLKTRLERAFTAQGNHRYIEILPKVVDAYNNSFHRSIGMRPAEVTLENSKQVMDKLYPNHERRMGKLYDKSISKTKYKINDMVRITREKGKFEKGFEQNWSLEIYRVIKVHLTTPVTYELSDYINEPIEGTFYESELQRVKTHGPSVEKVVDTRKRGREKQYLVKYFGYPEETNSWLTRDEIINNAN